MYAFPFPSFLAFLAFIFTAFLFIGAVVMARETFRAHKLGRESGALKLHKLRRSFYSVRAELVAWLAARVKERGLKWIATDNAPDTFERLMSETSATRMLVSPAIADNYFGNAYDSNMFQAWHDSEHHRTGFDFSEAGEAALTTDHMREAKRTGLSSAARAMLKAAVMTRVRYYFRHNRFPTRQSAMLWLAFAYGESAALANASL